MIPSSNSPLHNASRAIAVCAYPKPEDHTRNGRAEKYSLALLAREFRAYRKLGFIDRLPEWAKSMRVETMKSRLSKGHNELLRAFTVRDLIYSAQTMKNQHEQHLSGENVTFTLQFSADLQSMSVELPIENTVAGYILAGKVPDTNLASLRAAILFHRPALERFQGPAVKDYSRDTEADYQNAYNRYVRPGLFVQHIVQVVWEQAIDLVDESVERGITLDELLMRHVDWAENIHSKTNFCLTAAIYTIRHLGLQACRCQMIRFAEPLPDS